jgi:outer membrane biosynthesis protein TonB
MPQSHRDHGVAEGVHWLLDEAWAPRSEIRRVGGPLPALLRNDNAFEVSFAYETEPGEPARSSFLLFLAALVGALFVYVLLHVADVGGAREGSPSRADHDRSIVVNATLAFEPRAGRIATMRARLQDTMAVGAATPQPRTGESGKPSTAKQPEQPKPPPPPDDILPPLPPPPAPLPLPDLLPELAPIPELPLPRLPDAAKLLDDL